MGRTNATFRDLLRRTEREWQPFRRALRRRDREHFDSLLEHARNHADAAGNLNPTDPVPAILLSAILAQERERAALEQDVGALAEQIEAQRERIDELEAALGTLEDEREQAVADADGVGSPDPVDSSR